jgi:hypothetical protein
VQHHDRAMVDRELAKARLQLIAIQDPIEAFRGDRLVSRQQPKVWRPASLSLAFGIAGANQKAVRPRVEARGVAQLRKVLPDAQQRLLRCVLCQVEVAQDPARHGQIPIGDSGGKENERLLVTALSSDHEIGIHCPLPLGRIGSNRCASHGMGTQQAKTFKWQSVGQNLPVIAAFGPGSAREPILGASMPMKQMYHPDDLGAMDPLVLMRNLDHVRMTSRRLSYILQQQVHLYTPEANQIRSEIDQYVEAERQIEWEMARRGLRS